MSERDNTAPRHGQHQPTQERASDARQYQAGQYQAEWQSWHHRPIGSEALRALKRSLAIEDIVRSLGVRLVGQGRERLVGHCPFHDDTTPSFTVYRAHQRFICYGRCGRRGDVLDFVQLMRGCSLHEAVLWLSGRALHFPSAPAEPGGAPGADTRHAAPPWPVYHARRTATVRASVGPHHVISDYAVPDPMATDDRRAGEGQHQGQSNVLGDDAGGYERRNGGGTDRQPPVPASASTPDMLSLVLTVATALYAQQLTAHPAVLDYLRMRGVPLSVARRYHVGYTDGRTVRGYLASDSTWWAAGTACGLLTAWGREQLAGRLVIPEIRAGRTAWMIGRVIPRQPATPVRAQQVETGRRDATPSSSTSASTLAGPPASILAPTAAQAHATSVQASSVRPPTRVSALPEAQHIRGGGGAPETNAPTAPPKRRERKYLGLGAPRVLLGYGATCERLERLRAVRSPTDALVQGILVVEGAIDYLIAQSWRLPLPCVATLGTYLNRTEMDELADLCLRSGGRPLFLALDADAAGREATGRVRALLLARHLPVRCVPAVAGAKDLGDLGKLRDGRARFLRALRSVLHETRDDSPFDTGNTGNAPLDAAVSLLVPEPVPTALPPDADADASRVTHPEHAASGGRDGQ